MQAIRDTYRKIGLKIPIRFQYPEGMAGFLCVRMEGPMADTTLITIITVPGRHGGLSQCPHGGPCGGPRQLHPPALLRTPTHRSFHVFLLFFF
jgi:hypothetical protein